MQSELRPIQYLGGKGRFLEPIAAAVDSIAGGPHTRVVDLFAGTGVVARRLADDRPVLAADIQAYSVALTAALLAPVVPPQRPAALLPSAAPSISPLLALEDEALRNGDLELISAMIEGGSIIAGGSVASPLLLAAIDRARSGSEHGTMLGYYGGVYFGYRQAAELDALSQWVRSLPVAQRTVPLAALIGVASEVSTSIGGHFAQPLRTRTRDGALKESLVRSAARTRTRDIGDLYDRRVHQLANAPAPRFPSTATRADFRDVLAELPADVSCVYADPPYTRDHYSRFYHVLETLALGDEPGVSTVATSQGPVPSRGLYRVDRHQSPFSIVSQAPLAFRQLFEALAVRGTGLVLSYSPTPENEKPRARTVQLDQLIDLARDSFSVVRLEMLSGIRHSKLTSRNLHAPIVDDAEVLVVARP